MVDFSELMLGYNNYVYKVKNIKNGFFKSFT